jgi:hypothetical protein
LELRHERAAMTGVARALLLASLLVSVPRPAASQRWTFNRSAMKELAIPRAIRDLPGFGDLDYDDTSRVFGLRVDLNRDGRPDYIIRSAESLCGTGGCPYLLVDGATGHELGTLFGTVYVESAPRGRYPTLHSLASLGAFEATWTEYVYDGGKYAAGASRELSGAQLDSVVSSLKGTPSHPTSDAHDGRHRSRVS